ncbi:MAG TPA: WhiB family transcriptional regulator [Acidimicrobiales bacterium]|nr:WhiB family transcriptional regulator [Acidimicrobiales bacterium]
MTRTNSTVDVELVNDYLDDPSFIPRAWRAARACADVNPSVFFDDPDDESGAARAVCAACPVQAACLAQALTDREDQGVWGGLTERERRAFLRRYRAARRSRATAA